MRAFWNLVSATRYGWSYFVLGVLSWGQITSPTAVPTIQDAGAISNVRRVSAANNNEQSHAPKVGSETPVITILGLCANKAATKVQDSDCKTVITQAQFERMIDTGQTMSARAQREFAERYADALVMAQKAEELGMDRGAKFEEKLKLARVQILSDELKQSIQKDAAEISSKDIENYYNSNAASFEVAQMERIHVPKAQESAASAIQPVRDADDPGQLPQAGQSMAVLADQLHARAIAGEDFSKLQADANRAAGIKSAANASMGRVRRISFPSNQAWVMDLPSNDVSSVIADANGYSIYKVKTKEKLSLDQAREEIIGILRSLRLQERMRELQDSATPVFDETYFLPHRTP
jgi:hypothetical protein